MTLPSGLGYEMADAVVVVLFYILWIVHYSDALPICCKTTTIPRESHVTCSGCRLLVIPQDLPTNTTVLDLSNNNLKGLKQGSFPQLLHLKKKLNLQRNQLVRISSGAFDSVSNVEELDLSYNKLEHRSIDFSIFMSLKHLTTLKMYRNNFNLEKMYPGEVLSTLSNLRILFLDIFDGFDFNTGFSNLSQLQKLYLFATWSPGVSLNNTSFLGLKQTNITYLSIEGYIVYMEKKLFITIYKTYRFKPEKLEKNHSYAINKHALSQDIPGRDIADNIMDAIDSSRQIVFVVSYASLDREWTTFTMRLAYEYSFRIGREKMDIFILLGDIKKSEFRKLIRNSLRVIQPLRWHQECNTNMERMTGARTRFGEDCPDVFLDENRI
ncbi:leucine-rich repeat and immunoglobulin-like domain-containing nogo receptor-interacting protein 2 [Argopecten irradians]|uniref:leucine-rich repeat and immunoglobulin-like domain-containing nogo receptor-interacting protein 2 n=1 Tax=Argopecten irradians TaxID=31199 RepID=UPI003721CC5A